GAPSPRHARAVLAGRRTECARLDQLLAEAHRGQSGALVLQGEPGIGKSALLEYAAKRAEDSQVLRATGVESEMELPFAGVHQLCAGLLDGGDRLPTPQRDALATAFGLRSGSQPDRFLVGLAVLSLLSEAAEEHALVCLVDDAQWLDRSSAEMLAFAARRLGAESIVFLFAEREPGGLAQLAGLPELRLGGLPDASARELLASVVTTPLDEHVRDRILAETRGNPLALLELADSLTATELAGGFGLPDAQRLPGRIEQSFVRRIDMLCGDARQLLSVEAAEPVGDPQLLGGAAKQLRLELGAADDVQAQGLLALGERVTFRHPLVRSAVYRSAAVEDRRAVHLALAEATERHADPDRRAWHLAAGTQGPDERIALELERSAGRARARGGAAAAAAFMERAVALTQDPGRRADRALAAAEAAFQAGAFDTALRLISSAKASPLDELQVARADLVRAQVAFATGLSRDASTLLLKAARRLNRSDPELARQTYLTAWCATTVAPGDLEGGEMLIEISQAVLGLPRRPGTSRPLDLLLKGLALLTTDGHAAATPVLVRAARALAGIPVEDVLRWGWMAMAASNATWDNDGAHAISVRHVELVRGTGALALP